jgi:hypothetical protein
MQTTLKRLSDSSLKLATSFLTTRFGKDAEWFYKIDLSFKHFRLMFIFNLNFIFKMAFIRVCFSPGWLSGEGFSAEEFASAWW